jgi:hypothetical protein
MLHGLDRDSRTPGRGYRNALVRQMLQMSITINSVLMETRVNYQKRTFPKGQ